MWGIPSHSTIWQKTRAGSQTWQNAGWILMELGLNMGLIVSRIIQQPGWHPEGMIHASSLLQSLFQKNIGVAGRKQLQGNVTCNSCPAKKIYTLFIIKIYLADNSFYSY